MPLFVFCSLMALYAREAAQILIYCFADMQGTTTWEGAENPFQSLWNTV